MLATLLFAIFVERQICTIGQVLLYICLAYTSTVQRLADHTMNLLSTLIIPFSFVINKRQQWKKTQLVEQQFFMQLMTDA